MTELRTDRKKFGFATRLQTAFFTIGSAIGLIAGCAPDRGTPAGASERSASSSEGVRIQGTASASRDASSTASKATPRADAATPAGETSMVRIPEGRARICEGEYADSCGDASVDVTAFQIDRTEVTVGAYTACVEAGVCSVLGVSAQIPLCNWTRRDARGDHPINCVDFDEASAFCAWAGKRLPTGPEWALAAGGTENRFYPWGDSPLDLADALKASGCVRRTGTCPSGIDSPRAAPFELKDMSGNVREWTTDEPCTATYRHCGIAVSERQKRWRVVYGTSWADPNVGDLPPVIGRTEAVLATRSGDPKIGFRCAR